MPMAACRHHQVSVLLKGSLIWGPITVPMAACMHAKILIAEKTTAVQPVMLASVQEPLQAQEEGSHRHLPQVAGGKR